MFHSRQLEGVCSVQSAPRIIQQLVCGSDLFMWQCTTVPVLASSQETTFHLSPSPSYLGSISSSSLKEIKDWRGSSSQNTVKTFTLTQNLRNHQNQHIGDTMGIPPFLQMPLWFLHGKNHTINLEIQVITMWTFDKTHWNLEGSPNVKRRMIQDIWGLEEM